MQFQPILVLLPLTGGVAVLGISGKLRERRKSFKAELAKKQEERREALSAGSILRSAEQQLFRALGKGEVAVLVVGSYAAQQLPRVLKTFEAGGCASSVGHIYLIELDGRMLATIMCEIPAIFHDRIVTARVPNFPAGMFGAPIADVLAIEEHWHLDLMEGSRRWLAKLQRAGNPAMLVTMLSPGGHAALGRPVVEAFINQFPHAVVFGVTILDDKDVLRDRFPELRQYYQDCLLGMIVTDNRRVYKRNDLGISVLFAALAAGTWLTTKGLGIGNAAAFVFPKDQPPPRLATISVAPEMVPVFRFDAWQKYLPEVFWTRADAVEVAAMRAIKSVVEQEHLQALSLDKAGPGRVRVCCVIAPIEPEAFAKSIARIEESLEAWRMETDPNLSIQFASIGAYFDAETDQAPLIAVLLQPLEAGADEIDGLARGTFPVAGKFLPGGNSSNPSVRKLTQSKSKEKSNGK
jgi:hypothetical protein